MWIKFTCIDRPCVSGDSEENNGGQISIKYTQRTWSKVIRICPEGPLFPGEQGWRIVLDGEEVFVPTVYDDHNEPVFGTVIHCSKQGGIVMYRN